MLATRYIDEVRAPEPGRFDLIGFVLSGTALSTLIFGLEFGSRGVGSVARHRGAARHRHRGRPALLAARPPAGAADPGLPADAAVRPSASRSSPARLSRIAVGAVPFLLPMMLQLGFGFTAARSGAITFAGSIGSLAMRSVAPALLRRIGFRNTLVWVGALSTVPAGDVGAVPAVLADLGDVRDPAGPGLRPVAAVHGLQHDRLCRRAAVRHERGDSFYTTFQQLSLSLGIGVSAASLAASMALAGRTSPLPIDFSIGFLVVAGDRPARAADLDPACRGCRRRDHRPHEPVQREGLTLRPPALPDLS